MAAFELHRNELRFRCHGYFVILVICAAASLFAKPAASATDVWTVVQGSGTATHWSATGRAAPLNRGDIVAAGDSVETGPDGRWVLQRRGHADSVMVSPSSRFMIPAPAAKGMLADIIQSMGTLFFNVEHTPGRRFEVDGPYLAAVVKGTSFTIAVAPSESTVDVQQGAVEVQSTGSHQVVLLGPGQFAKVSGFGRHEIIGGARHGYIVPPPGGARVFAAGGTQQTGQQLIQTIGETHIDIGALTNNLVMGIGTPDSSTANVPPVSTDATRIVRGSSSVGQSGLTQTGQASPRASPMATTSPSTSTIPAVSGISSVGQNSLPQIGQPSTGGSPTANIGSPSTSTMAAISGISSVGQSSLPQAGPSTGGSPTANIASATTGATPTVGGILSVGHRSLAPVGLPTSGGLPPANVSPATIVASPTIGGILSVSQSSAQQTAQPSPGAVIIPIKVPSSTAVVTTLPLLAPTPVAPAVSAPANSPATGSTGTASSVLGTSLGALSHK